MSSGIGFSIGFFSSLSNYCNGLESTRGEVAKTNANTGASGRADISPSSTSFEELTALRGRVLGLSGSIAEVSDFDCIVGGFVTDRDDVPPSSLSEIPEVIVVNGITYTDIHMIGCNVGEYKTGVGTGAFGVAYVAKGPDDKEVVLKLQQRIELGSLAESKEAFKIRTLREWDCLRCITENPHPGHLSSHGVGITDNSCVFVTDFFPGETLCKASYLTEAEKADPSITEEEKNRRVTERKQEAGMQLANAIMHLHQIGYFHKDIKPENVLVRVAEDGSVVVKLIDFGVSARMDDLEEARKTAGTPSTMAPEVTAENIYEVRSDVFSLGSTLYKLFNGAYPYPTKYGNQLAFYVSLIMKKEAEETSKTVYDAKPSLANFVISEMLKKIIGERPSMLMVRNILYIAKHPKGSRFNNITDLMREIPRTEAEEPGLLMSETTEPIKAWLDGLPKL